MSGETQPNFMELHHAFAATEHGQKLASQVRYDRYKPEDVSNERWVELLGADVNNLTHMPLTYGLTQDMIRQLDLSHPGLLNDGEKDELRVAALIHDWAEALVGDITYSDKTSSDEEEERLQFGSLLSAFEGENAADMSHLIANAADKIVFDPNSKLGQIFNTVERVGYVRTAIRASKHVRSGDAADCEEGLKWLVADVFGNHIEVLLERLGNYMPVYNYLSNQVDDIKKAFQVVTDDVFANYPVEQQGIKRDAFYQAKRAFNLWFSK